MGVSISRRVSDCKFGHWAISRATLWIVDMDLPSFTQRHRSNFWIFDPIVAPSIEMEVMDSATRSKYFRSSVSPHLVLNDEKPSRKSMELNCSTHTSSKIV